MSVYFDQIEVGETYVSQRRTVTEADIGAFAGLSGDFNPLHTDDIWVRENTGFSGRIAHGLLITAISSGLRTPRFDDWHIEAFLGTERRMTGPTYPGDTLRLHVRVESKRDSSSRPGSGIVVASLEMRNQRDEVVQTGSDTYLVAGRPV